ncbi:hypothetical protein ACFL20_13715, partial [Spirochaetota bacterium]
KITVEECLMKKPLLGILVCAVVALYGCKKTYYSCLPKSKNFKEIKVDGAVVRSCDILNNRVLEILKENEAYTEEHREDHHRDFGKHDLLKEHGIDLTKSKIEKDKKLTIYLSKDGKTAYKKITFDASRGNRCPAPCPRGQSIYRYYRDRINSL